MRLFILIITALLSISAVNAQDWLLNFDDAKETAVDMERNIVVVFQGSDWCAPCIKLEREIWSTEEFKELSKNHFVFIQADFPRRKQNKLSDEQQNHNNLLAEKYNKNGHFPLVVLLNEKGETLGSMGYEKITPTEYFKKLTALENY